MSEYFGFAVLSLPLIAIVFYLASIVKEFGPNIKKFFQLLLILTPVFSILSYTLYESGIPHSMNIRIDLIIMIPAVLASFWPWILFGIKRNVEDDKTDNDQDNRVSESKL